MDILKESRLINEAGIPLCPQNGRNNALICEKNRKITVISEGKQVRISIDGRMGGYLKRGEQIEIVRGKQSVRFLEFDGMWQINTLNHRLNELI